MHVFEAVHILKWFQGLMSKYFYPFIQRSVSVGLSLPCAVRQKLGVESFFFFFLVFLILEYLLLTQAVSDFLFLILFESIFLIQFGKSLSGQSWDF